MRKNYIKFIQNYTEEYLNFFKNFDAELVIYDKIEDFKDYNDPDFDNPYLDRKTVVTPLEVSTY